MDMIKEDEKMQNNFANNKPFSASTIGGNPR
jgi:hypothetical protein